MKLLPGTHVKPDRARTPIPVDAAAREEIAGWVGQHWDAVFAVMYRMAGNRHEAEDLAQETFLRAASQRGSFVQGTNLRAWLMRIASNAFVDGRRRARIAKATPLGEDIDVAAASVEPAGAMVSHEFSEALAAALLELPETGRMVFLLRTREELSFREIAETIGISEDTARWHMFQARQRLMERLEGWR